MLKTLIIMHLKCCLGVTVEALQGAEVSVEFEAVKGCEVPDEA